MPRYLRIPKLTGVEWLLLLLPMFRFVKIHIVGELFVGELLLIMLIPLVMIMGDRARLPRSGVFILALALCWLGAQIATDLYVGTAFDDLVRGWSNISFLILGTTALVLLPAENDRKIWLYLGGWAVGGLLQVIIDPTDHQLVQPMKWGFAPALSTLAIVFLSMLQRKSEKLVIVGLVCLTLFSVVFTFRSSALINMGALTIYFLSGRIQNWTTKSYLTRTLVAVPVFLGTLFAGLLLFQVYDATVKSGVLGSKAQNKHVMQTGTDVGFLLSARGEVLISGLAIMESPIIGHGSWAKDHHFASLYVSLRRTLGQAAEEKDLERIPSHSHIMGAWVEAGIVGAMFWMCILAACIRVLISEITSPRKADILAVNLILAMIWGTLFSPFNGQSRYFLEFGIMVLIFKLHDMWRHQDPKHSAFVTIAQKLRTSDATS